MRFTIADLQPILYVDNSVIVTKNGDIAIGFEIKRKEIFTLHTDQYIQFNTELSKAVESLPDNTMLHFQEWYISKAVDGFEKREKSFLEKTELLHFNERNTLNHTSYLFISLFAKRNMLQTWITGSMIEKSTIDESAINEWLNEIDKVTHNLTAGGLIQLRRLATEELIGDEKQTGLYQQYLTLNNGNINCDIQLKDKLQVGNNRCGFIRVAHIDSMPNSISPFAKSPSYSSEESYTTYFSWAYPMGLGIKKDHIYNCFIFSDNQDKVLKNIQANKVLIGKFLLADQYNKIHYPELDDITGQMIQGNKMVRIHANIMYWDTDATEYNSKKNNCLHAFKQTGCIPNEGNTIDPVLFFASIPGAGGDMPEEETFMLFAKQAACMVVAETTTKESASDYGIRLCERLNHQPLLVDITEEPKQKGLIDNRNKFIIGGSGGGKSVLTNHILRNYYDQGCHCIIVDNGDSYKRLCKLVGGCYYEFTDESKLSFNPFNTYGQPINTEQKDKITGLLLSLWKKDIEAETKSLLEKFVSDYYVFIELLKQKNKQLFPCFNTFYEFVLKIKKPELEKSGDAEFFNIRSFSIVMAPFYKGGEYDYLLNSTTQVDLLKERFIVFELKSIERNEILFAVATFMIMDIYIRKLFTGTVGKKVIVIEEAWKAICKTGMDAFIKYLVKTVRKYNGETIFVTQELEDIVSSEVVKSSVINNSDCKIILSGKNLTRDINDLQHLLGLTTHQKNLVLSLNKHNHSNKKYKECYIGLGSTYGRVFGFEPSPQEYACYTTEQKEYAKIYDLIEQHKGNVPVALQDYTEII